METIPIEREREKEKDFEDDFLLTKSFSFFVETFFSFHAPAKERQAGRQVLEKHRDCKRQREREEIETGRSTKGNVRHGLEAQKGTK